ncbi:ABC transporter substrate-binding protein [Promicromonospora sp. Marseille-Q5078]
MTTIDRRSFLALGGTAALAGVLGLSGCGPSGPPARRPGTLTWWDEFQPLQGLEQGTFDSASKATGVDVDYTVYDPAGLGSALQLAQQSGLMPDVFTNGFGIPAMLLVENGWVRPLDLPDDALARFPEGTLLEGLHTFDGRLYSFPLFSSRQHVSLTWFDRELVERAGADPATGPRTWDEFRQVARRITRAGDAHGWIEGIGLTDRMRQHVVDLAAGAGAQLSFTEAAADSPGVADARTGDYPFDGDEFASVLEFLGSLVRDGVMFPSSTSLDVRTARAVGRRCGRPLPRRHLERRRAQRAVPRLPPRVGVGNMPTPDGTVRAVNGPVGGAFWLSSATAEPEAATRILATMTGADYAAGMAAAMDQPPADAGAVNRADVPELYRQAVGMLQDTVTPAPSPLVRNPAVGLVLSEMVQVRPTLGEIVQGYLGGNVDDVRGELRGYTDRLRAERDRAVGLVAGRGHDVSVDDWRLEDASSSTTAATAPTATPTTTPPTTTTGSPA